METFNKNCFLKTTIERIKIPNKMKEMKPGWCKDMKNLTQIIISTTHEHFKLYNEQLLIGKSNTNSTSTSTKEDEDKFDTIYIAIRNISEISIPDFIKFIEPYSFSQSAIERVFISSNVKVIGKCSFEDCVNCKNVEFSENSQLHLIDDGAFLGSSIETIIIPKNVRRIGDLCFAFCKKLLSVSFPEDSELVSIGKYVFENSTIQEFNIPKKLQKLDEEWCYQTPNLISIKNEYQNPNFQIIEGKILLGKHELNNDNNNNNNNDKEYEILYFATRDIQEISIPIYIKEIKSNAFYECEKLQEINFEEKSKLEYIGKNTFSNTSITNIIIPKNVKFIGADAFFNCKHLRFVEFDENSKLEVINEGVFNSTAIKRILIPKNVEIIEQEAFDNCFLLKSIQFAEGSKLNRFEPLYFDYSSLMSIHFPPNFDFSHDPTEGCYELTSLEFLGDYYTIYDFTQNIRIASYPNATEVRFELSNISILNNTKMIFLFRSGTKIHL